MNRSSIALYNLRAVVIIIVLAFHSVLPYLASLPATPYHFDSAPYQWLAFPIVDNERWFGFDLFCAWQDVGLMTLMFFLSGLFVPSSLARKGSWKFLSDRLLRIGVPFVLAVIFLAPLAYYPAYRSTAVDPGFNAYWQHWLALPFWPSGPAWFCGSFWRSTFWRLRCMASYPDGASVLSGWRSSPAEIRFGSLSFW
jgi:glucans biosynthesis protein C